MRSNSLKLLDFFDRISVTEYNYEKFLANDEQICTIQAKNSCAGASAAISDVAGGVHAVHLGLLNSYGLLRV